MEKQKSEKKWVFAQGTTDEEKKTRFLAGGIVSMGAFMVGGIFQVLWIQLTTRALGPKDMGLFGPLMGLFWAIASLIGLGIPQTITTFVSHHYERDFEQSRRFTADGIRLLLFISVIFIGLAIVSSTILQLLGKINTFWMTIIWTLSFSCALVILFGGVNGILNGFQRLDLVAVGNLVYPLGLYIATFVLITLTQRVYGKEAEWDVVGAVSALGIGNLAALIAAIYVVRRTQLIPPEDLFSIHRSYGLYRRILTFGSLAAVVGVSNAFVQNITSTVVGAIGIKWMLFGNTMDACKMQIGYFSTALIFGLAPMLIIGIAIALIPAISEAEGQGRKDMMQSYYSTALQQSFIILITFIIIYSIFIGIIIESLSGPAYPAQIMGPLSTVTVMGGCSVAMLFLLSNMFIGLKRPHIPAILTVLVLAFQIGGIVLLGFLFRQVIWAGAGFALPATIGVLILFVIAHKRVGLLFPYWTLLEPLAAALPAWALVKFIMPHTFWYLGVDSLLLMGIYGGILWLFEQKRRRKNISRELLNII